MADGRWVMTEEELNGVAGGFAGNPYKDLINWGKRKKVDARAENSGKNIAKTTSEEHKNAERRCAFCGSGNLIHGLGGYGKSYSYSSCRCKECGGLTDFVTRDDKGELL